MPDEHSFIRVLAEETVNQIAAGEVVERPASILKELVENAIDAGADRISIEVATGKKEIDLIRVTDNGSGIPAGQVPTAFLPHATSKIRTVGDLDDCLTLGFRGEALSSIAAIAQVTMVTRPEDQPAAYRIVISGGMILEEGETGAPEGTAITVADIFHTTPARRKFLKSLQTELSHLIRMVEIFSLTHPGITFRYLLNGQEKLSTHGSSDLAGVIRILYGDETGSMLAVDHSSSGVTVRGYISGPALTRQNPQRILLSVNGRVITSARIGYAIRRGYGTLLPASLYPVVVIGISLDPAKIDANIHPTKREVRFSDENLVFNTVTEAVRETLRAHETVFPATDEMHTRTITDYTDNHGSGPAGDRVPAPGRYALTTSTSRQVCEATLSGYRATTRQLQQTRLTGDQAVPSIHEGLDGLSYVGQIAAMYLVFENEGGDLLLVDQHAAHERIRYDQLKQDHETGVRTQELIVPVVLSLSPSETARMPEVLPVLSGEGFMIEPFGKETWCVRGVPVVLGRNEDPAAVREILAASLTGNDPERLGEMVMKMVSCRGAVKAGTHLTADQAEELIHQLAITAEPFTCPHGRPTVLTFSREHLEKLFRRT